MTERIGLNDRLRMLEPIRPPKPPLLKDMTLQTYVNTLRAIMPNCREEVYRLLRCSNAQIDMNLTMAEVIYKASGLSEENADRILYDTLVRPYLRIMREDAKDE